MESSEELQQLELTALKSIYADDFLETPPPKAWKGAPRLHEFTIRVPHPDAAYASKICFNLHVIFPKTYPAKASPTFTIQKPIIGISNDQTTTLLQAIQNEAKSCRGAEMTFQIVTFCQDWLTSHVVPPIDTPGSLANQMTQRALEEERARKQREADAAEQETVRAAKLAQELEAAVKADAQRQQLAKERQYKARKRANSEATEVPVGGDTPTESFSEAVVVDGVQFHTVRIFHPQPERLGTRYTADPVCDDVHASLPLQLYVVPFASHYYITSQGKKKLKQVEAEIRRLITICHPNLLKILAVKLTFPHTTGVPRLVVLHEAAPGSTLRDVLEDCDALKEARASEYLVQILSGLNSVHAADIVHRGIAADCIGITSSSKSKMVKLTKVAFYTRLLDLHRSNAFGPGISLDSDELRLPDPWLSKDVKNESALLYTRHRDIHAVGIVLMQMLLGLDVAERYPDAYAAMRASNMSPNLQRHALSMLFPSKKNHLSCLSLLADLAEAPLTTGIAIAKSPLVSTYDLKTPMPGNHGSPEIEYFRAPQRDRQSSRWKEDWEELELLGKGAFGSVVKARNKIDSRIYAVKKIRLSTTQSDTKIFREVNALSRLSHRFIVRYFTTWVETAEAVSAAASDESGTESGTEDGTSVPDFSERRISSSDHITFDLGDLDDVGSGSRSSFPSIHFSRSSSPRTDDGEGDESDSDGAFGEDLSSSQEAPPTPPPILSRTLYIQMEFVERQTLKERISEGLSEEEAWRLFQQILEALVYMSSLGILHRDIKLTNIFIGKRSAILHRSNVTDYPQDAKGDAKVGDFGLATSNLSAPEPHHLSHPPVVSDSEMTLEVGTRLYIAPEVQSRKRGPRNHTKADMYSLGIVFFEMNYKFSTGSERIAVIEDLRQPLVVFPSDWDSRLTRQRQIITCLLDHDPDTRPTALELSQSPLLPSRLEDEYFKGALGMMVKQDSPHHQAVLASLFSQSQPPARRFLYDVEFDLPEHAALNDVVKERLSYIFRLHGAVDMEPPLLLPLGNSTEDKNQATYIDRSGEIVVLPLNLLVPFARLAAKGSISRIKRYHIANVYRENAVAGHPKFQKAALFDIISSDVTSGPIAAAAEIIAVANDCLDSFPNLNENYEIHVSHSSIVRVLFDRIPSAIRPSILEIISHSKSSPSQKRALLLKLGLLRSIADELEALTDTDEDIDALITKLDKVSPSLTSLLRPIVEEVKETIQYAVLTGVARPISFRPLMLGNHHTHFKDGVLVEVVRKNKRTDVLAAGGRYDGLIRDQANPGQKLEPICAMGLQIAVEKITVALAAYQVSSVRTLVKQERSFGFWSPRRCDVYVVSFHPGYLQDRLEVVSFLWQHNISADLMYESSIPDAEHESYVDICSREGVLFSVYPRPRTGRRDQLAFKVKSILKGTEYELTRQELVGWLQQQIAEQKRVDASTCGALRFSDIVVTNPLPSKEPAAASAVQLLLPVDIKKQRKQVKQLFMDRAFETGLEIESGVHAGMPILAVDVLPAVFDAMIKGSTWLTDEDVWKALATAFPVQQWAYAQQIREAVVKRKAEGHRYILLFAVREERVQLLKLT
ncbi:kinase-like domain-containing protein [Mycena maculata]|uniref:non-specific serine/threonine protein kinase n=1 Tax=Mycena maculata TaxID=230809 RepID=A0AAD7JAE3_9AGAR|nr:kinase-like domain-containing protein [Mycena maculata]